MLGSSCGCFALGGLIGFLMAVALGIGVYCCFFSEDKEEYREKAEQIWNAVSSKGKEILK